ncbi:unnamed protein product, partial [Choristocarpus tenellus]
MTDRTAEFQGVVKVFRRSIPVDELARPPPSRDTSDFFRTAASIALGFEGTSKLIDRVKKLVGRKGFSNNPAAEINVVMNLFESDMADLQRDIEILSLQIHASTNLNVKGTSLSLSLASTTSRYTDGNSKGGPRPNSQHQKHCLHIVTTLRNAAKEHTKAFRDALLLRAAVEKQQNDRQRIFSHSRGVAPMAQLDYPLFGGGGGGNSGLKRRDRYKSRVGEHSTKGASSGVAEGGLGNDQQLRRPPEQLKATTIPKLEQGQGPENTPLPFPGANTDVGKTGTNGFDPNGHVELFSTAHPAMDRETRRTGIATVGETGERITAPRLPGVLAPPAQPSSRNNLSLDSGATYGSAWSNGGGNSGVAGKGRSHSGSTQGVGGSFGLRKRGG